MAMLLCLYPIRQISLVVTVNALCAAPSQQPAGVRVTLIEDDTALVSWREPTEPNVIITHYTILYASQKAWMAGHWQKIQREGECSALSHLIGDGEVFKGNLVSLQHFYKAEQYQYE